MMPRNKHSTDIDFVPAEPTPKRARKQAPKPWPIPKFNPIRITNPLEYGRSKLPIGVEALDSLAIFLLFFTIQIINLLVEHTNQFAALHNPQNARDWTPVSRADMYRFIACLIHMGLHSQTPVTEFWSRREGHDMIFSQISLKRFQQIDRFFHISKPKQLQDKEKESPFEKVDEPSEHLRQKFKEYWHVGTHIAVDEAMAKCQGRAAETVDIPSKPISKGFKIWCLANDGYLLDWMFHSKGSSENDGPVGLDDFFTSKKPGHKGFSKTQALVFDLISQLNDGVELPFDPARHIVWLDNLFPSVCLFSELAKEGIGAAGTVRTRKTKRELLEENWEESASQPQDSTDRGVDRRLVDLERNYAGQIEWGQLYGAVSKDGDVLEFAWMDAQVVLFLTNATTGENWVIRERRRPPLTSTHANVTRKPFGEDAVKTLPIPENIDLYNYHKNAVDRFDQRRASYTVHRRRNKTWKSLWSFLLDAACVNAFLLSVHSSQEPRYVQHRKFRKDLVGALFEMAADLEPRRFVDNSGTRISLNERVSTATVEEHRLIRLADSENKHNYCAVCQVTGKKASAIQSRRKPFKEMSKNSVRGGSNGRPIERKTKPPKSRFGCSACGVFLCRSHDCWDII